MALLGLDLKRGLVQLIGLLGLLDLLGGTRSTL
jgi:hypothetical protein